MNRLLKNALLITACLNASISFAECNTDPELKLIKFEPSNLAAYVPKNVVINKTVYDGSEDFDTVYDIAYKGQEITFYVSYQLKFFESPYYESIKIPNVSNTAKLLKKECGDRVCATAYLILNDQDSIHNDVFYYNDSISYSSKTMKENEVGDEFIKSLFVDTTKCMAAELDSLIYNGPSEIRMFYFDANSAIIPNKYYDNEKFKHFADFVSRNDYNIVIEGHTGKDEIKSSNDSEAYSIALSRQRAEAFRDLLIDKYDLNPDTQIDIQAEGSNWPVALSRNEEEAKMNHRVRAYIDTRRP